MSDAPTRHESEWGPLERNVIKRFRGQTLGHDLVVVFSRLRDDAFDADHARVKLITALYRAVGAMKDAAQKCERCEGKGVIWRLVGSDEADRDPCDDCFNLNIAIQIARDALATSAEKVSA